MRGIFNVFRVRCLSISETSQPQSGVSSALTEAWQLQNATYFFLAYVVIALRGGIGMAARMQTGDAHVFANGCKKNGSYIGRCINVVIVVVVVVVVIVVVVIIVVVVVVIVVV
jgi:hypothetical protein